jgi:hypothetical protein
LTDSPLSTDTINDCSSRQKGGTSVSIKSLLIYRTVNLCGS